MREKLDLQFLKYDRHNLMNDLQLIYGFLQMDRPREAMKNTEKLIAKLNKERKLFKANLSSFAYVLKMYNFFNDNIRLSFSIKTEHNLKEIDSVLSEDTEKFLGLIREFLSEEKMNKVTLQLEDLSSNSVQITFIFENFTLENTNFYEKCQTKFYKNDFNLSQRDKIYCSWTYNL